MALGKYKLALRDYERVSKVRPNDKDAKAKFTECRKILQQIAFNKAIAVDEKATFAIFLFRKCRKLVSLSSTLCGTELVSIVGFVILVLIPSIT